MIFQPILSHFSRRSSCALVSGSILLLFAAKVSAEDKFTLETAKAAAEKGNAEALYFLGACYSKGEGVPQDYTNAAICMQKAAEKGNASAQNDLGAYYAYGLGVQKDFVKAAGWYRKAAEHGDPLAQYSLGHAYYLGCGVSTNMDLAFKWLKKASRQKQSQASELLGQIYLRGAPGIKPDPRQACHWLTLAVRQGSIHSLYLLGIMYETGAGVDRNMSLAVSSYRKAAESGHGLAQMHLSQLYLDGADNLTKDPVEGAKWLILASKNRTGSSAMLINDLQNNGTLTKEQYAEALRRANEVEQGYSMKDGKPAK